MKIIFYGFSIVDTIIKIKNFFLMQRLTTYDLYQLTKLNLTLFHKKKKIENCNHYFIY